MTSFRIH